MVSRHTGTIVRVLITFLCLWGMTFLVPLDKALAFLKRTPPEGAFWAIILGALVIALSSVRFHRMMEAFGVKTSFAVAHRINILSTIFGLFALQSLGQIAFRSVYAGNFVAQPQRMALITLFEKVCATATLLAISVAGAIYATRSFTLQFNSAGGLVLIGLFIVVSGALTVGIYITDVQRRYLRALIGDGFLRKVTPGLTISLLMHLITLSVYVILARYWLPGIDLFTAAAIFAVVMLGAAIPISFAGIGLRELSAGFIFSYVGLDPAIGVAITLVVGFSSLIDLGLHGAILPLLKSANEGRLKFDGTTSVKNHFDTSIAYLVSVTIPILIALQVRIPTPTGALTLNFADPFAFVAAVTFLTIWFREYLHQPLWRVKLLSNGLAAMTVMIVYGLVWGVYRIGFVDWAVFNRGIGWLVLLAYLLSGAMVTGLCGSMAVRRVVAAFTVAAVVALILYALIFPLVSADSIKMLNWNPYQFNGMIGNRNAMAYALAVILCCVLAFATRTSGKRTSTMLGCIVGLVFLTGSRTGFTVTTLLLIAAMILHRIDWKALRRAIVVAGAVVGIFCLSVVVLNIVYGAFFGETVYFGGTFNQLALPLDSRAPIENFGRVQSERIFTYVQGFNMWQEHWFMGAGLGAFIKKFEDSGFPQIVVIHNTVLWILAETGIIGFSLAMVFVWSIVEHLVRGFRRGIIEADLALAFLLGATLIFSLAHEILYQRILWFILGMLVANRFNLQDTLSRRFGTGREQPVT